MASTAVMGCVSRNMVDDFHMIQEAIFRQSLKEYFFDEDKFEWEQITLRCEMSSQQTKMQSV